MNTAALLRKARKVREKEHRLKPSLRLESFEEIRDFVDEKGLVSTLGGNELPGLISAILGRPWRPTGKGFTSWLDWWNVRVSGRRVAYWLRELANSEDVLEMRIFRDTKTLVAKRLWPVLDPIIERYQALASQHKIFSRPEWRILDLLKEKGATRTDRLREVLGLTGKPKTASFHQSLARLESFGLIVGHEDPKPERHMHANIWQFWNQTHKRKTRQNSSGYARSMSELLKETIDAVVIAEEKEIGDWFRWDGVVLAIKENLVATGQVIRASRFLLSSRVS